MNNCEHEELELKQALNFEFAEIHNSAGDVLYVVKLCKKCHLLYWENAEQSAHPTSEADEQFDEDRSIDNDRISDGLSRFTRG